MSTIQYKSSESVNFRSRSRCITSSRNDIPSNPQQQPPIITSTIANIRKRKLENINGELVIDEIKTQLQLRLEENSNFDLTRDNKCGDYLFSRVSFGSQGNFGQGNNPSLIYRSRITFKSNFQAKGI